MKTATIKIAGNQIFCSFSEMSINDAKRIRHSGFSIWDNRVITHNDTTCLLILYRALSELNYSILI